MERSIYDCIKHLKQVSKKKPTFDEKILASMSKLDTVDNLDADKLKKRLSGITENQRLELSDDIYKIKGKDTIESALPEISETETIVISETQMTPEKAVDNEVIEEQMVNNIESPTIYNIDQSADWKNIINVMEDHFTKIEDALVDFQTQQFSKFRVGFSY